ncbi:hypothetical protein, partial [Rhodoferax sp.]|uniref:hypothetical protein n=1 Tax=Rhodoferax sp. TaxID=50421 RepID=UPI0025F8F98A
MKIGNWYKSPIPGRSETNSYQKNGQEGRWRKLFQVSFTRKKSTCPRQRGNIICPAAMHNFCGQLCGPPGWKAAKASVGAGWAAKPNKQAGVASVSAVSPKSYTFDSFKRLLHEYEGTSRFPVTASSAKIGFGSQSATFRRR